VVPAKGKGSATPAKTGQSESDEYTESYEYRAYKISFSSRQKNMLQQYGSDCWVCGAKHWLQAAHVLPQDDKGVSTI